MIAEVNYEQLKSGRITIDGQDVQVGSLSSYTKAQKIAALLRDEIARGDFRLTEPMVRLPLNQSMKPLKIREKSK